MPHVLRGPQGQIESVHRQPVPGSQRVAADDPALLAFLEQAHDEDEAAFASLDAGLIRVLEDLVDVLVARNVINITDLPAEAQRKLFARKNFRERFQRNALQLFGQPEDLLIGQGDGSAGSGGDADLRAVLAAAGLLVPPQG